jgi:ADP-heptose:LPS heptosyltransferase
VISPYSRELRNQKINPKNYPWWTEVIEELIDSKIEVIQIGRNGEQHLPGTTPKFGLTLKRLSDLILSSDTWVSVDNFMPHFCNIIGKPGIVIYGPSDPSIYGYTQNVNLYKGCARPDPFGLWESIAYDTDRFVNPAMVIVEVLDKVGAKQ